MLLDCSIFDFGESLDFEAASHITLADLVVDGGEQLGMELDAGSDPPLPSSGMANRLRAAALIAGAMAAVAASTALSARVGTRTLAVPADTTFASSGVTLAAGESAVVTARGTISYGSQNPACSGSNITPDGCSAETICPVAGGCGALVGRLGNGAPFFIGRKKTVDGPGLLWLGINDVKGDFGDNSGAFEVTIVTRTGAPNPPPSTAVATLLRVSGSGKAWLRDADGTFRVLDPGDPLKVGDTIVTDRNTSAVVEFTIGGRSAVRGDSSAIVVSERSVDDAGHDAPRAIVRALDIFGLDDSASAKSQHVEIQTNGGVIGIKG